MSQFCWQIIGILGSKKQIMDQEPQEMTVKPTGISEAARGSMGAGSIPQKL